jgi:hypothetical protein
MQMIFIGAALLIAAGLSYLAVKHLGRWAVRKLDAHEVLSHARKVNREAERRERAMRKYSMTDLKPVRGETWSK